MERMFSVQNMIQFPSLRQLIKSLPSGEWPILRDGVPFGKLIKDGEDSDWHPDFWEVLYNGSVVYTHKTYDNCFHWLETSARHETHQITNGLTREIWLWDTDHFVQ